MFTKIAQRRRTAVSRTLAWTSMSAVTAVAATVPAAAPAHAASCSGSSCEGADPQSTGCAADAYTLETRSLYNSAGNRVGKVDLRYSLACRGAWSRTTSLLGSRKLKAALEWQGFGTLYSRTTAGTSTWSPMTYMEPGSGVYRASGRVYFSDNSGYWSAATRYYGIN
jgi:hypothetical protein